MRHALLLAAFVLASPTVALAQDAAHPIAGAGTAADVKAGTYKVEPNHTQAYFTISHMGITPFTGVFSGASGTLKIDPAKIEATTLDVSIPVASVETTSSVLSGELKSAEWLDAAQFPTASFRSTKVVRTSETSADIEGVLTLHGVSHPEVLHARFFGTATNPLNKKLSLGFVGRMVLKRSDFGVTKYVPLISDETLLTINGAFEIE